ncbi:MAG TPA: hypothetical protein VH275_07700 [Solirubrobacterales bacterium]|jgi:hypothetical protein|nr:hypothetical protein [Solirubrobacterales bacterium]
MEKLRPKLSYANVIATLALFLALGGGAAYAASNIAKNSVGAKQLKRNAVTGAKVKDGSLLAGDFKAGQLPVGERGPQGLQGAAGSPGAPGATDVVVRYGEEGKPKEEDEIDQSDAQCLPGEAVTGGGFDIVEETEPLEYTLLANRPDAGEEEVEGELIHPAPADGNAARGWVVMLRNDSPETVFFRAYVMCARP